MKTYYLVYDTKDNGCLVFEGNIEQLGKFFNKNPAYIRNSMYRGCLIKDRYEIKTMKVEE